MKKIVINSNNRRFNISSIVVGYLEENKEAVLEFEIPEKYAEYGKKACFSAKGQTFAYWSILARLSINGVGGELAE